MVWENQICKEDYGWNYMKDVNMVEMKYLSVSDCSLYQPM
jgi:hypothetical protein